MRITSGMYYKNIIDSNNSKLTKELFDVNKQISSGLKIQYAHDDVRTFTETMRLDNEIVTLEQITKSTQSGYKFSNQSDVTLNEFETSLNRTKVLLLQAANGTNDDISLDAIAQELRAIEKNFINLANTSINGQYLFSGSAVDTKPIDKDGNYMGNDSAMSSFTGSQISQQYNLSGAEFFLGDDNTNKRVITTNVANKNLISDYPSLQAPTDTGETLSSSSSIRDLMGDSDNVIDTVNSKHFFYIRGTQSDGDTFNSKISMRDDESIDDLLDQIGDLYGNASTDVVNVSMNGSGQIVIEDKLNGSSKLDFHIVGATDFSGGAAADINDIDLLDGAETDFNNFAFTNGATVAGLFVKEFTQSSLTATAGAATNIEGLVYDRANFSKDGSTLTSSMPQVLKAYNTSVDPHMELDKNDFATPSTKISDVANAKNEILPATTPKTYTLDTVVFNVEGNDTSGAAITDTINFSALPGGSTFTVGGVPFNMLNVDGTNVDPDKMTYRQLMDVVNMIVTGTQPAGATSTDYNNAVAAADSISNVNLTHDGKIEFKELGTTNTRANIALYDANSDNFASDASVMTFNANNALTVRDPKTDFFKSLDEIISSVENHKFYPDSSTGDARNVGIDNAMAMIDDLQDHVFRSHSKIGAQSNALETSLERTSILEISTRTLRSEVVDTDLAEASLKLTQLNLNYQAMLSTVGQISQLSLVNYL